MPQMAEAALARGFEVLILTNAMRPLQRPRVERALLELNRRFGARLQLRVSLDHYTARLHEAERGRGSWDSVLAALDWLSEHGFSIAIAGRTCWGEAEADERQGYAALIAERGWPVDASDPTRLVLFPEMDERIDVAEITTACWEILGKSPGEVMCATSRMVVKRKGEPGLAVLPCTLLPYDRSFEMGGTLSESLGVVKLNHPHCARFCVLGGGSCSAPDS
jgi:MoaA/NifB/PqqE/SkfB family radical SAM enzyme